MPSISPLKSACEIGTELQGMSSRALLCHALAHSYRRQFRAA